MIKKALVLLPPGTERNDDAVSPLAPLAGLTLIQRVLYSLQWAGIREGVVLSHGEWPGLAHHIRNDPKIQAFSWLSTKASREYFSEGNEGFAARDDCIVLFPNWIVDRQFLKDLCGRERPLGEIILFEPSTSSSHTTSRTPPLALVPGTAYRTLIRAWEERGPFDEGIRLLQETTNVRREPLPEEAFIRIEKESDLPEAERKLFQRLIKPTESFLSQRFERKVSLAITRRLLQTRVTPNQISIASILLGVFSALLFLGESRILHVTGALLLLLSSIVDGCDGELARLRFQESRGGSWLDFLGDNVVHLSVFLCLGFGLALRGEGWLYAVLGGMAAVGNIGAASAVFFRVFLKSRGGVITFATPVRVEEMDRASGWLKRRIEFVDKLSNRDFFYVILILAVIGQLWIFMWLASFGALFYFFNLLYLYHRMRTLPSTSSQG
jgi:phosphatidylglycerophosphate synthase